MFSENFDRVEFAKKLQARLLLLRTASGYTQSETAEKLGIVRSTYVNYENGSKEIPWEKCLALCFFFEKIPACLEIMTALQILPDSIRGNNNDK